MKRLKPKKKLKKKSLGRRIDRLQPEQRKQLAVQLTAMLERDMQEQKAKQAEEDLRLCVDDVCVADEVAHMKHVEVMETLESMKHLHGRIFVQHARNIGRSTLHGRG